MSLLVGIATVVHDECMTTMTSSGRVPEFTLGWRMRLAIESAGMSVQQMADTLGYSRSSISRWLNDQDEPRAAIKAQWALLTGVDRDWLEQGHGSSAPPPPRGGGEPAPSTALGQLTTRKRARTQATREGVSTPRYGAAA